MILGELGSVKCPNEIEAYNGRFGHFMLPVSSQELIHL